MRDVDRLPVGDDAYTEASSAGMPPDGDDDTDPETPDVPLFEDPSFTDTKAYAKPSLGGEFGPGGVPVLSGPADGGADLLDDEVVLMAQPDPIPTPPFALAGRSRNPSTMRNLYPWLFGLTGGLRWDRDAEAAPASAPGSTSGTPPGAPLPPQFELSGPTLNNEMATFSFSGTATRHATVHATYVLNNVHYDIPTSINALSTASQTAAAVRASLRANGLLTVTGSGGTVIATPVADLDVLTAFTVHLDE